MTHPIELIRHLLRYHGHMDAAHKMQNGHCNLTCYGLDDEGYSLGIRTPLIPVYALPDQVSGLCFPTPEQEVGICSNFAKVEYPYTPHFAFFDLAAGSVGQAQVTAIRSAVQKACGWNAPLTLYCTHSSFHGYFHFILHGDQEWRKFMGALLLVDPNDDRRPIIDRRWVGQSLVRGHGVLRWTSNTPKYRGSATPKRLEAPWSAVPGHVLATPPPSASVGISLGSDI